MPVPTADPTTGTADIPNTPNVLEGVDARTIRRSVSLSSNSVFTLHPSDSSSSLNL